MNSVSEIIKTQKLVNILFVYVILTALPFITENVLHFPFLGQGTTMYSIYINIIFFLLPLRLLFLNNFKIRVESKKLLLIFLMIAAYLIALINGSDINETLVNSFIKTLTLSFGILIFYYLSSSFYLTEQNINSFFKKVLFFILFAIIINFLLNFRLVISGVSNIEYNRQFASFFYNKNTFGQLLILGVVCSTYLYFLEKKKKYLYALILILLNIIWTNSTNVLFSTIIFAGVFFLIYFKKKYIKKYLFYCLAIIILYLLFLNDYFNGLLNFIRYGDITEFNGRTSIWADGLSVVGNHLFFGVGMGQRSHILESFGYEISQFHNGFIEILVVGGVILFLIYIFLFVFIIKRLILLYKRNKLIGSVFLGAMASLLFSMFFESLSFFDAGYYSGTITIFYLIIPLLISNYFFLNDFTNSFDNHQ